MPNSGSNCWSGQVDSTHPAVNFGSCAPSAGDLNCCFSQRPRDTISQQTSPHRVEPARWPGMWNSTGNHDSPLNHSLLRGQARIADNRTARSPRRPRPYRAEQHPVASQSSRERSCTRSCRPTMRIRSGLAALNSAGTGIMFPVSQPDSRHLPAPIIGRKHFKGNHVQSLHGKSRVAS